MVNDKPVKVGYSMHLVNKETSEIEERPVSVKLPKWIWGILRARADYCHDGSLDEAFAEIMALGIQHLYNQVTISDEEIPTDPGSWS